MSDYHVKWNTIPIVGGDSLVIRSLLDKLQFSDDDGLAESVGISSAAWPMFGLLWPSGYVLAAEMMVRELDGLRILEIGCGLGLASLVAHRRGANVLASDAHPLAQTFLDENTRLNGLGLIQYHEGCWAREYPQLGLFDLIIGSDVLYERDEKGVLAGFIERHANLACEVLIVDPNRGNRSHFHRHMARFGFTFTQTNANETYDGVAYRGRQLRYIRAG
jgi:predicted nicotinamide N-methyase